MAEAGIAESGEVVPIHWVHPREHVPLCIVVGTCAQRDTECHAVRSAEGVTCPECLGAMRLHIADVADIYADAGFTLDQWLSSR